MRPQDSASRRPQDASPALPVRGLGPAGGADLLGPEDDLVEPDALQDRPGVRHATADRHRADVDERRR